MNSAFRLVRLAVQHRQRANAKLARAVREARMRLGESNFNLPRVPDEVVAALLDEDLRPWETTHLRNQLATREFGKSFHDIFRAWTAGGEWTKLFAPLLVEAVTRELRGSGIRPTLVPKALLNMQVVHAREPIEPLRSFLREADVRLSQLVPRSIGFPLTRKVGQELAVAMLNQASIAEIDEVMMNAHMMERHPLFRPGGEFVKMLTTRFGKPLPSHFPLVPLFPKGWPEQFQKNLDSLAERSDGAPMVDGWLELRDKIQLSYRVTCMNGTAMVNVGRSWIGVDFDVDGSPTWFFERGHAPVLTEESRNSMPSLDDFRPYVPWYLLGAQTAFIGGAKRRFLGRIMPRDWGNPMHGTLSLLA